MNFIPDRDLVVRELPTLFNVAGELVPSLAVEAMRVAQGASTFVVRATNASGDKTFGEKTGITSIKIGGIETLTGPNGAIRIRYAGTRPEREIAAWKIFPGSSIRSCSTAPSCSSGRRRAPSTICARRRSRTWLPASKSTPR